MSDISREFFKLYRTSTILEWVWAAIVTGGLFLTSRDSQTLRTTAIIVSSAAVLYAFVLTVLMLTAPACFKRKLSALPENDRNEFLGEKSTKIGKRRFFEHYVLYFSSRRILFVKFSDIKSLEPKGNKLILKLENGKTAKLPVDVEENSAMLAAALKSKNPEIAVIINGKVVERTEKPEEKEETK